MSKIVVVEDDQQMARLLRTIFELEGYQVVQTSAYQQILPIVRQTSPDVVLLDVRIQGRETMDLVRNMRQEGLTQVPVVMVSGMDLRRECLEAGANCFVPKPFLPDELVQVVRGLVKERDRQ